MPTSIANWEKQVAPQIDTIELSSQRKGAVLLALVPSFTDWDEFKAAVKCEWVMWKKDLLRYPASLVLLYAGLAFYEYDDNTFWPHFAAAASSGTLPANQQQEINGAFAAAAKRFGLVLKLREKGTDFVGSAVNYIGVPLSLWDGFLTICEWALWRKDWKELTDADWADAIDKRSGSRRRLKNFLTDNRELATNLVQDVLDVREILAANPDLTLDGIAQASILRTEYFDEVPETADFLRPDNPESLFQGRARIVWNERGNNIAIQLPGVSRDKLPATWHIGPNSQLAATNPDVFPLDSAAFCNSLVLTLTTKNSSESQRLRGLRSWGLFDMVGGHLINANTDELRLKSYTLVGQKEIDILSRSGFDEDDYPANECFKLRDGKDCFITRLWPTGNRAELRLQDGTQSQRTISFRTRNRIEARFFVGLGCKAAFFTRRDQNDITMGYLPILCVTIPNGYFSNDNVELTRSFKVLIDGKPATGQWEYRKQHALIGSCLYFWKWSSAPILERKPEIRRVTGFGQLSEAFKSADLGGRRRFSIEAIPHLKVQFNAEIVDRPSVGLESCWKNLPGAYLPLVLLCQSPMGMKWEELLLAKDVLAPNLPLSIYLLHKYAQHGLLLLRGHRWEIRESRAEIATLNRSTLRVKYCGDPSKLWGLYTRMSQRARHKMLPMIDVKNTRGEVPYLQMDEWPQYLGTEIEKYFENSGVNLSPILWTH